MIFSILVNIREIKEIRRGINSRDFEKNPEQTKKLDVNCCLVIFYGTEFKLKTLSCAGKSVTHYFIIPIKLKFMELVVSRF